MYACFEFGFQMFGLFFPPPFFLFIFFFFSGPDKISSSEVKLPLTAIYKDINRPLPPLNWASILAPLLRQPFSKF